jgi:hypothetical protein
MPYATPNDCRVRAVGVNTLVIPDTSSTGLNLTLCITEADVLIDEAARAGEYALPFSPVPERITHLSAIGGLARARRALELGNQNGLSDLTDAYLREFERGLDDLRSGEMDPGTTTVASEAVTMAADYSTWSQLAYGGIMLGSVTLVSSGGGTTFTENRDEYDPDYLPDAVKDYQVDHTLGRVRRLDGGHIGAGEQVVASYEYSYRQPTNPQDAEYAGKTAAVTHLRREDG